MRSTLSKRSVLKVVLLSSLISLLCSTCSAMLSSRPHPTLTRGRRSHPSAKQKVAHHRPLTHEQKADQHLQFMLSLYKSAAEPDGRPKQHRKFGSNTVRLLRPSASSVNYLPDSKDHHYSFTVQYNVDTLPSEQLVRASFVHFRASSLRSTRTLDPPRCRAQMTSLGRESVVTLEPHERWTETDITAQVQQKNQDADTHLTLTVQYWCTELGDAEEDRSLPQWWTRFHGRKRWRGEPHLEMPSLLLYLEEEREVKDWMGDLLGTEGEKIMKRIGQCHSSVRRRRSKDLSNSELKDPSLDVLKNAPTSLSSSSFSTSSSASIFSDIPNYKLKTSMPKNRCKLHSFRLSFDELGLGHYFIAPPVYNPRFCQGNCPRLLDYGYHSPNHAIIQTVINDLGVGDVPAPSCVPYKYMPMSVLVVQKKRVEYRELDDMVAGSCTCR